MISVNMKSCALCSLVILFGIFVPVVTSVGTANSSIQKEVQPEVVRQVNTVLIARYDYVGTEMEACADHMIQKKGQGTPSGPKCTKSKMVAYGFTLQENIRSLVDYRKVLLIFAMPGELVPLQLIKGNCYLVLANIEPDKYKSIAAFTLTAPANVSMFETECGQAF